MRPIISKVILTKEIDWSVAQGRDILYTDMMRNRVTLHGSARVREEDDYRELWDILTADIRKFCNDKNVGLFAIEETITAMVGQKPLSQYGSVSEIDSAKGQLTIYFEDAGDYARFLKDKAVMFKLSINTQ